MMDGVLGDLGTVGDADELSLVVGLGPQTDLDVLNESDIFGTSRIAAS